MLPPRTNSENGRIDGAKTQSVSKEKTQNEEKTQQSNLIRAEHNLPLPTSTATDSSIAVLESSETDQEPTRSKKRQLSMEEKSVSDSDSDETDKESGAKQSVITKTMNKGKKKAERNLSASSPSTNVSLTKKSSVTSIERSAPSDTVYRTSRIIEDSDEELNGSKDDSDTENTKSDNTDLPEAQPQSNKSPFSWSKGHCESNRISFRKTRPYDPSKSPASNLSTRLNNTFIPRRIDNQGFVTSDSDSDGTDTSKGESNRRISISPYISGSDSDSTDSNNDDDESYPPWQRTLGWRRKSEDDSVWPKPRKLGYSDKLRLEKRIKKVCKQEGITFEEAQDIFSTSSKGHLRLFQRIGKIFPDMPLYRLVKLLKEMYHVKRNAAPWTPEEIQELDMLIGIHGFNTRILSKYMDRSPKNISDFYFRRKINESTKPLKRWTQEEDEKLARLIATKASRHPKTGRIEIDSIVPEFNGERSKKQIYSRYYRIQHRIRKDGSLIENREATPYEELAYLKSLLDQVEKHNLIEESQLDFQKHRGFVNQTFYLRRRATIEGFEKKKVKGKLFSLCVAD
ncbi:hypothetical protein BDF20DRAFT_116263 [Mycotypha africana]|uniref:uncharacterized protein n=1 Tax=Mycotypha africana TaxID=64632 RepID=UPI0023014BC6|nr:uncharacterized protein BDF20DRAFT_116263 [Mycotypha africana]KAI8970292.1 hypothetical protein BDF20DRAFT_116263 [Mycotypha africana]